MSVAECTRRRVLLCLHSAHSARACARACACVRNWTETGWKPSARFCGVQLPPVRLALCAGFILPLPDIHPPQAQAQAQSSWHLLLYVHTPPCTLTPFLLLSGCQFCYKTIQNMNIITPQNLLSVFKRVCVSTWRVCVSAGSCGVSFQTDVEGEAAKCIFGEADRQTGSPSGRM